MSSPSKNSTFEINFESHHGIDFAWEEKTGLPFWYGWTVNHILGMLQIGTQDDKDTVTPLREDLIRAARFAHLEGIQHLFLMDMLEHWLTPLAEAIPAGRETVKILITISNYRAQQESGNKIHSRDWKKLTKVSIPYTRHLIENVDSADHRHCLFYVLSAAASAAEEENPLTIPDMVREVANAHECFYGVQMNETYKALAKHLIGIINIQAGQVTGDAVNRKLPLDLLRRLGTYTPPVDEEKPPPAK